MRVLLLIAVCLFSGCGVIAGTLLDRTVEIVTYPIKEYVAWGAYRYDNTWDEPWHSLETGRDPGEELIGLCISGGGSRSAYFLACVLEELSRVPVPGDSTRSMLDELDFISSVSGGSLGSAYYCLERFGPDGVPVGTPPGDTAWVGFFERYKLDMGRNFQMRALVRMMLGWWILDFFTYYDRADLFAGIWDDLFFDDRTFADLAEAERNGAPVLVVNGTALSNGVKFVFSTLDDTSFNRSQWFAHLDAGGLIEFGVSESHGAFLAMGFQSLNIDISQYRVSKAVAASASVPNLLGPITLRAGPEPGVDGLPSVPEGYLVNVTDGGVYDNYGLETMMQVVTEYLDRDPGKKASILVVDGSGYFDLDPADSPGEYNVAYYIDRTLSISWLRSKSYMEYVFSELHGHTNADGVQPYSGLDYQLLSLYTPLPSQLDVVSYLFDTDDRTLRTLMRPDVVAGGLISDLTTIPTMFDLSEHDAKAIEQAAANAVQRLHQPQEPTD